MQWGQFVAHDITLLRPDTSIGNDDDKYINYNFYFFKPNIVSFPIILYFIIYKYSKKDLLFFIENCCAVQNETTIPMQCREVINIPSNDPVYSSYNKTCMTFNRAVTSANFSCPLIPVTFVSNNTFVIENKLKEYMYICTLNFSDGRSISIH